ncbi:MAG: cysteine synthase family protein [Anaerolineales bacterium]|nr:cysteine synthase family protein [Anaerolineales bacterium]
MPELRFSPAPAAGDRPAAARVNSLTDLVGNTPLIRLRRIAAHLPETVEVYAKAEWYNPSGSVKDRPALNIIRTAEADGRLTPDKVVLDSTSGNMGIAYATLAGALGYQVRLVIPENASPERFSILRALGASFTLSSPLEGSDGAIREARRLAAAEPERFFYANQYNNPANWQAHFHSTGPEIIAQTDGAVTHFVAGLGTSGTFTGVGRALKAYHPGIQLIAFQPNAPFHGLEGLKHMPTAIKPGIYDQALADENLAVSTEAAHLMTRRLAREEGLFVGISAGAAAVAALQVAETLTSGVVVTLFPDAGYKYVSERFWNA